MGPGSLAARLDDTAVTVWRVPSLHRRGRHGRHSRVGGRSAVQSGASHASARIRVNVPELSAARSYLRIREPGSNAIGNGSSIRAIAPARYSWSV